MNTFKTLFLMTLIFVGGTSAHAQGVVKFHCNDSSDEFRQFSATLDYRGFQPGSGLATMTNAHFNDNYLSASLHCESQNEPGSFSCLGFINGETSDEIKITLHRDPETQKTTLAENGLQSASWICK